MIPLSERCFSVDVGNPAPLDNSLSPLADGAMTDLTVLGTSLAGSDIDETHFCC